MRHPRMNLSLSCRKPGVGYNVRPPRHDSFAYLPVRGRLIRMTRMLKLKYKGYSARVDHDDEDGIFAGRIAGLRDGVGFHADDMTTLRDAFREAVDDYVEACARVGKVPQRP